MKRYIFHIIFLTLASLITSCGNKIVNHDSKNKPTEDFVKNDVKEPSNDNTSDTVTKPSNESGQVLSLPDTHFVYIDTTLQSEYYSIIFTKEKFDASQKKYSIDDVDFNPLTVFVYDQTNDSVIYKKLLDENQFVRQRIFKEKQTHYIILSSFSGGSGYVSTVYKLNIGKGNPLQIVYNYSELTSSVFSSDGSQVLIMQGIWDMRDESDESHFSDHKYEIQTVDLNHPEFKRETIGYTVHKYPSADYDFSAEKLLKQIHQKEPQVFKNIKIDKFLIQ